MGHSLGGFLALFLSTAQPEAIGPLVIRCLCWPPFNTRPPP